MYLCSFPNLRLSRLPCVVSELALAEDGRGRGAGGGGVFVCVHTCPPPAPFPKQGSQCMSAFLSSFGVYTRDDVYVRCVACEFPAYVECVLLAALAPQLGLARRVGRRPLVESPEFGWRRVELLPCDHW